LPTLKHQSILVGKSYTTAPAWLAYRHVTDCIRAHCAWLSIAYHAWHRRKATDERAQDQSSLLGRSSLRDSTNTAVLSHSILQTCRAALLAPRFRLSATACRTLAARECHMQNNRLIAPLFVVDNVYWQCELRLVTLSRSLRAVQLSTRLWCRIW